MRPGVFNVPQGIGDIFWVYQKLAPHFDTLHFNVFVTREPVKGSRQRRSESILDLLGVSYDYVLVSRYRYQELVNTRVRMEDLGAGADYCVNKWLESGVSLYKIDNWEVYDFVDLGVWNHIREPEYLCLFLGNVSSRFWNLSQWVECVEIASLELGVSEVRIIGAEYDSHHGDALKMELERHSCKYEVTNLAGSRSLLDSINVIRFSKYFIGYQSGLNVLAENYNCHQMIIYFNNLEDMRDSWTKPDSEGRFDYMFFGEFDNLREKLVGAALKF